MKKYKWNLSKRKNYSFCLFFILYLLILRGLPKLFSYMVFLSQSVFPSSPCCWSIFSVLAVWEIHEFVWLEPKDKYITVAWLFFFNLVKLGLSVDSCFYFAANWCFRSLCLQMGRGFKGHECVEMYGEVLGDMKNSTVEFVGWFIF